MSPSIKTMRQNTMRSKLPQSSQCLKLSLVLIFLALHFGLGGSSITAAEAPLSYERDIRPIFRAHCFDCHGATEETEGGLDLRLVRFMKSGGDSGPAIELHHPDQSLLIERIESGEMPPGDTRVSQQELETLNKWIEQGCNTLRTEPESIPPGLGITPEERDFWAFKPIDALSVDELNQQVPDQVATNAIDKQLVLEAIDQLTNSLRETGADEQTVSATATELMEVVDFLLAPQASRPTLIRRAFYDLVGLPPSPEQMQQWMDHADPQWYSSLIDSLLDSPQYGERWGRHWLDIAGYSDSEGYTNNDTVRQWAWRYRDWVIESLNQDKPLNEFIIEQLAGDEIAGPPQGDLTNQQIQLLTATGFLRMAADGTGSGANTAEARNQVIADTLKIVGTSLLGLSVQCAQCHDHRYDPIPQEDYYALRAVFEPAMNWQKWKVPAARQQSLYTQADRDAAAAIEEEAQVVAKEKQQELDRYMSEALSQELEKQPTELRETLKTAYLTPANERTPEQQDLLKRYPSVNITPGNLYQYIPDSKPKLAEFDKKIADIRSKKPEEQFIRSLTEPQEPPPETKLFHRGEHQQPKQSVQPHALQITCPENQTEPFASNDSESRTTGRRLAYAKWLTSDDHPLFKRVIANRIWLHHFGSGIVKTPSDFGRLGNRPSHPRLLDKLATELSGQQWSLKSIHRTIMHSKIYRQTRGIRFNLESITDQKNVSESTQQLLINYQFPFANLIRVDAEAMRDSVLKISGKLDTTVGGKPVAIKEDETGAIVVEGDSGRRSVYIQSRRTKPVSLLQTFDAPVMETNCELRASSTVATQSLMMLNGNFILENAKVLAERAASEAKPLSPTLTNDLPPITEPTKSRWSYGFGRIDPESQRTEAFTPLEHWTGSQWQAGPSLPDPTYGWALLTRSGGHPDSADRSVIRRWEADASGTAKISGILSHGSPNGDGVQGRIISSRLGQLGSWSIKEGQLKTEVESFLIASGDTIDFVTDSLTSITSDSFNWPIKLTIVKETGSEVIAESETEFTGPQESLAEIPSQIVRAWQLVYQRDPNDQELEKAYRFIGLQIDTANRSSTFSQQRSVLRQCMTNLCQMLLSSNEFFYVE